MSERSVLSPSARAWSPLTRLMLIGGERVQAVDGQWREITSPGCRGEVPARVPTPRTGPRRGRNTARSPPDPAVPVLSSTTPPSGSA